MDAYSASTHPPAGRRALIAASARLPLSEREWRGHLSAELLAQPGVSPAHLNEYLQMRIDAKAVRLLGLSVVQPDALVAIVRGRDAREFVVMLTVDRTGMIKNLSFEPSASGPVMTLPAPTGPSAVGTDAVALADPARGGRRVMVSVWYPATSARGGPLAVYASPRLAVTLGGLPPVRVHARYRPRPPGAPSRGPLLSGARGATGLLPGARRGSRQPWLSGDRLRSHRRGAGRVPQRRHPAATHRPPVTRCPQRHPVSGHATGVPLGRPLGWGRWERWRAGR